jgi:hypothetical protein
VARCGAPDANSAGVVKLTYSCGNLTLRLRIRAFPAQTAILAPVGLGGVIFGWLERLRRHLLPGMAFLSALLAHNCVSLVSFLRIVSPVFSGIWRTLKRKCYRVLQVLVLQLA